MSGPVISGPAPGARRPASPTELWPFVGRDGELDRFRASLHDGRRTGLLVVGPAGVGKTRLAEECLAVAAGAGVTVARAVTSRTGADIPLGAIAHLVPLLDAGGAGDATDAARLLDRTRAGWSDRAGGDRQVVFVDDLDLLDPVSLELLTRLAGDGAVFLLATLRAGTTSPAVGPRALPEGMLHTELGELDIAGIDRLLGRVLGGPVTSATLATLCRTSQGNALFLRELVLGSLAAGTLVCTDDVWRLVDEPGTTPRLDQLVEARLASLPPTSRELLEHVAVCQPLEAAALDELAAPAVVTELVGLGVLRVDTRGRRRTVGLAHPLYVQAVRNRTPSLRTERILRTQIDRVRRHGARRQEDALRLAGWELAVDGTGDPALLVRAAQLSCAVHDYPTTERLAEAVLAAPGSAGYAATALFLLGHARCELHRPEEGLDAHEAATAAAISSGQTDLLVRIAAGHAVNLGFTLRRTDEALAVVERAVAAAPGVDHSELMGTAVALLNGRGRTGRAAELLATIPAELARTSPVIARARLDVLTASGRPLQALAELAAGDLDGMKLIDAESTSLLAHRSYLRFAVAGAYLAAGRLGEALAEAEAAAQEAGSADVPGVQTTGALMLARIHLQAGRARTAMRHFRELSGIARASGRPELLREGIAGVTAMQAQLGDVTGARHRFDELGGQRPGREEGLVTLAAALVSAAEGASADAVEVLQNVAASDARAGRVTAESGTRHYVARLGFPELVADRLAELAAISDDPVATARANYAAGLVRGDADLLTGAGHEFERFGCLLFAAEAFQAAGRLRRAAGRMRLATDATAHAAALLQHCEGSRSPAMVGLDTAVRLSRREREVALLAAAGSASRDIAERLGLSTRTVTNHLQNAYTKLGVSSRAELARALGSPGRA